MEPSMVLASTVVQLVLCAGGLLANVTVAGTVLRYRRTTFANNFYVLAVAVTVPDTVYLCVELFCSLPSILMRQLRHGRPEWMLSPCGFVANSAFWNYVSLMLVAAVNRYIGVCYFDQLRLYFSLRNTRIWVGLCAVVAFSLPTLMYSCGCSYTFRLAWTFQCADSGWAQFAITLNSALSNCICGAIVAIYVAIAVQYRRAGQRAVVTMTPGKEKRRRKEHMLMLQFALISAVLMLNQILFWVLTYAVTGEFSEVILNTCSSVRHIVCPLLYMTFGSDIRSRLPWRSRNVVFRPIHKRHLREQEHFLDQQQRTPTS